MTVDAADPRQGGGTAPGVHRLAQPAAPEASQAARTSAVATRPPLIESEALLQGHRTVEIQHQGVLYRLQATRQGKLILTK